MLYDMATGKITAEDVLRPDGLRGDCEIRDGLPLVREPPGGRSEEIASRIVAPLAAHVRERGFLETAPDFTVEESGRASAAPVPPAFQLEVRDLFEGL